MLRFSDETDEWITLGQAVPLLATPKSAGIKKLSDVPRAYCPSGIRRLQCPEAYAN